MSEWRKAQAVIPGKVGGTVQLVTLPWRPLHPVEDVAPAESDVPIPARPHKPDTGKHLRLFADLKPGQSRSFPYPQRELVYGSAKLWGRKNGARFSVRRDPRDSERARIWRIEYTHDEATTSESGAAKYTPTCEAEDLLSKQAAPRTRPSRVAP